MPSWSEFHNKRDLYDYDGTFTAGTFWVQLSKDGPKITKEAYEAIRKALIGKE